MYAAQAAGQINLHVTACALSCDILHRRIFHSNTHVSADGGTRRVQHGAVEFHVAARALHFKCLEHAVHGHTSAHAADLAFQRGAVNLGIAADRADNQLLRCFFGNRFQRHVAAGGTDHHLPGHSTAAFNISAAAVQLNFLHLSVRYFNKDRSTALDVGRNIPDSLSHHIQDTADADFLTFRKLEARSDLFHLFCSGNPHFVSDPFSLHAFSVIAPDMHGPVRGRADSDILISCFRFQRIHAGEHKPLAFLRLLVV